MSADTCKNVHLNEQNNRSNATRFLEFVVQKSPCFYIVMFFFFQKHTKTASQKNNKKKTERRIMITSLKFGKKKEVISSTELIADGKIAIILVHTKFYGPPHFFFSNGTAFTCKTH